MFLTRRIFPFYLVFLSIGCVQDKNGNAEGSEESKENYVNNSSYTNPILSSGADPWVIKKGDTYFYTHTTGNDIELYETSNMAQLNKVSSKTIWTPPEGEAFSSDIWAPELHHINGAWYMYFAATNNHDDAERRMFVLENKNETPVDGEWTFKGKIADETDLWAIDGTVISINEHHYFVWSGWRTVNPKENSGIQQLYIAKMKNPWTLDGTRVMISEPEYNWEKNGLVNEGPVGWKNSLGELKLFYSASGCWTDDYKIGMLSYNGGDPLDPTSWNKNLSPVFEKSIENSVYAPGHNSFFKSPDGKEDWILYHANGNSGDGCGGKRSPRMQKISWNKDGTPNLGTPVSTNTIMEAPSDKK